MKKIYTLIIFLLISLISYGQSKVNFVITPNCTYTSKDTDKSFYVFDYKGHSKQELFNKAASAFTKIFAKKDDQINKTDNSTLSVNTNYILHSSAYLNWSKEYIYFDEYIKYNIEFEFKDGKIKVNAPTLIQIRDNDGIEHPLGYFILSGNNKAVLANGAIEQFSFVNEVINKILTNIDTTLVDW